MALKIIKIIIAVRRAPLSFDSRCSLPLWFGNIGRRKESPGQANEPTNRFGAFEGCTGRLSSRFRAVARFRSASCKRIYHAAAALINRK